MISPGLTVANSGTESTPARMTYSDASISLCRPKMTVHNQRETVFPDRMKTSYK
jgi:hypothetical protein